MLTALANGWFLQDGTRFSTRKNIYAQHPLQGVAISLAGQQVAADPEFTDDTRRIFNVLTH